MLECMLASSTCSLIPFVHLTVASLSLVSSARKIFFNVSRLLKSRVKDLNQSGVDVFLVTGLRSSSGIVSDRGKTNHLNIQLCVVRLRRYALWQLFRTREEREGKDWL